MPKTTAPALTISSWLVIQAMQDGVVITDSRGAIMAANDAFCAVTGYDRKELIGRNPRLLHSGKHGRSYYRRMWRSLKDDGRWQGEIWNRRKGGALYPEWLTISAIKDRWGQTLCYLGVARDITSPKLNEERLQHLAQYDPLTSLPNRRLFNEQLARALASRRAAGRVAVLFLDLDHFKDINDRWGHRAGDAFLQAVGARLRGCVRRGDVVARLAGDEFAVLLQRISGRPDAARVARKILRVLRKPFTVLGRRAAVSASIGACLFDKRLTAERLLARADLAMYAVKKDGRDDVRFWTPDVSLRRTPATAQRAASAKPQRRTGTRRRPRPDGVHETAIRRA